MDPQLLNLFSDESVREMLVALAKKNRISFKEIRELDQHLTDGSLARSVKRLQDAGFVGVVKSVYADFDTYFLTAEGLKAVRVLTNSFAVSS